MRITIPHMDLKQIAESGQCFRWKRLSDDTYVIPGERGSNQGCEPLTITQTGDLFELSCSEDDWNSQWKYYFDMDTDYDDVMRRIMESDDEHAKECYRLGSGIRILRQELWEMIVSFLISQNNNISRITNSIDKICEKNGGRFPYPGEIDVSLFDDKSLGLGYRVPYLKDIFTYALDNPKWLDDLKTMDYDTAFNTLKERNGIGPKVANCICLFGLHHTESFPIDTHVKQLLEAYYPNGFDYDYYEGIAGIIQQYLFYYELLQKKRK